MNDFDKVWRERCDLLSENERLKALLKPVARELSAELSEENGRLRAIFTQVRLLTDHTDPKHLRASLSKLLDGEVAKPDVVLQASLFREAQDALAKELCSQGLNHGKVWQAFQEYRLAVGRTVSAGAANYAAVQIDLASSQGKVRQLEEQVEALTEEVRCLKRNPDWDRS